MTQAKMAPNPASKFVTKRSLCVCVFLWTMKIFTTISVNSAISKLIKAKPILLHSKI